MKLTSPRSSRENILGFGGPKSGKSEAPLSIVKYIDNDMYFIDNEAKIDYTIENNYPELAETPNLKVTRLLPTDWAGIKATVKEIAGKVKLDDWLVIDSITPTWSAAQDWWMNKLLGIADMDDFLIEHEYKDLPNGYWQKVGADYLKFVNVLKAMPCHTYVTAQSKEVDEVKGGRDLPLPSDLYKLYLPFGVRPGGHKELGYWFNEVILFSKGRGASHTMTSMFSASEKTRAYFKDKEFSDFAKEYLMAVAKWKAA